MTQKIRYINLSIPAFLVTFFVLFASMQSASAKTNFINITTSPNDFNCSTVTEIPQTECEALVAFYNSTGGGGWTDNTDWLVSETPCNWYGVGCNNGQVVSISLYANQLSGTLPTEIGQLSNLQTLIISINQIGGNLPPILGSMPSLIKLTLHQNQFNGNIPPELGNLQNLIHLGLDSNQLTGTIPLELGNLPKLRSLYLDGNQLIGNIPANLGNLTKIEYLNLSGNRLNGTIPGELSNLSTLISLDLEFNQLSGNIPPELGNLPMLFSLHLESNQLSGNIPPELGNLDSLVFLYLNQNQLAGQLPLELGNLNSLQGLFIYENQFSGPLPLSLQNLSLDYFWFQSTDLCEPDNAAFQIWLNGIENLESTDLSCIQSTIPTSGGNLDSPTDNTTYEFPDGTFAADVVVTHTPLTYSVPPVGSLAVIDHVYEVGAVNVADGQVAHPLTLYTITIQYNDDELGAAIENTLALYYWDGMQWVAEPSSTLDTVNNTITATPSHFSKWAILGAGDFEYAFLPVIIR